ncbi:MAG: type II toxin-antitoxin system RelE/ParE family toxin [Candidatus Hydrogenedentes bacterium]|nr:type II toxin-antitoxin system RelE/ParE family toxin [Candidatus Hydrogenedentota bacterium]
MISRKTLSERRASSSPELGAHVRSYRVALSKHRSGTGIKSPRHVVFYTLEYEGEILVLRILHDRMKPHNHVL